MINIEKEPIIKLKEYIDSLNPPCFSLDDLRALYLYLQRISEKAKENNEVDLQAEKGMEIVSYYGKQYLKYNGKEKKM